MSDGSRNIIYNDAYKVEEKIPDLINCELRQNTGIIATSNNLLLCCQRCLNSEFVPKNCPLFENDYLIKRRSENDNTKTS